MMDATDIDMSDEETFHLTDISAFSAPFFGIIDVSQRRGGQNQYVFFSSPCSQSVYRHLAKYGFSSDASIWLEPNTDRERPNTYDLLKVPATC